MNEKLAAPSTPPKNGKIKKMAQKLLSNGTNSNQVHFTRPETKHENIYPQLPAQKSLLVTYILWLFGGFFGLHHIYLHRDRHAFVWWCTLGGYFGVGWIFEVFKIPGYVRDANEDPRFISEFIHKLRTQSKPNFSTIRFLGEIMVGYLFGTIAQIAVPEEEMAGINWKFMYWTIPFFTALGL
jgi:DnaJ family protein C protein 22